MTKHKDGVGYTRPTVVEANIDDAVAADPVTLRRRLLITDRSFCGFLRSECLVHLIRHAHRNGDDKTRDVVLPVLLGRCEAILDTKISDLLPNAAQLRDEVLSDLCELLLTDGAGDQPDELDFYECKFNLAFRTLRLDVIERQLRVVNRNANLPDHGEVDEPDAYEDAFARVSEAFQTPAIQQSTLFLDDLWEAINALPPISARPSFSSTSSAMTKNPTSRGR
ncbi:hypothetical protein ACFQY5_38630 [Paeniroseomonas aquatica]|uniref:hypothetical protein n=1 Tax=Paeniroseomonas aquatica TaxID=373043 RepID=UPI00360917A5